jgi:hypothetical protein
MTAGKVFPITERVKLQFQSDFINLLNNTNFALTSGNSSMNSGSFGQLSSSSLFNNGDTGGPRVIQMTLRLRF